MSKEAYLVVCHQMVSQSATFDPPPPSLETLLQRLMTCLDELVTACGIPHSLPGCTQCIQTAASLWITLTLHRMDSAWVAMVTSLLQCPVYEVRLVTLQSLCQVICCQDDPEDIETGCQVTMVTGQCRDSVTAVRRAVETSVDIFTQLVTAVMGDETHHTCLAKVGERV